MTPPELGPRLDEAFAFAREAHHGHPRKGTAIPYLSHLLAVAGLALELGGGEDEAIAALLHDAVEDRGTTLDEVETRFGPAVRRIVEECSEDRESGDRSWPARKRAYLARIPDRSEAGVLVSLADKLHNARSLLADYRRHGEELWGRFDAESDSLWYYRTLVQAFAARTAGGALEPYVDELDRLVADLEGAVVAAEHPIPGAYWAVEGRLLAGEYPSSADEAVARGVLRRLRWSGVDLFLDLTEEDEYGLRRYAALLEGGAEHRRFPIVDLGVPDRELLVAVLDAIDEALAAGRIPYVHCFGGIGRTGTVIGCWLVRHGASPEEALATIADRRRGTPDGWKDSPEMPDQRALVRAWEPGR